MFCGTGSVKGGIGWYRCRYWVSIGDWHLKWICGRSSAIESWRTDRQTLKGSATQWSSWNAIEALFLLVWESLKLIKGIDMLQGSYSNKILKVLNKYYWSFVAISYLVRNNQRMPNGAIIVYWAWVFSRTNLTALPRQVSSKGNTPIRVKSPSRQVGGVVSRKQSQQIWNGLVRAGLFQ